MRPLLIAALLLAGAGAASAQSVPQQGPPPRARSAPLAPALVDQDDEERATMVARPLVPLIDHIGADSEHGRAAAIAPVPAQPAPPPESPGARLQDLRRQAMFAEQGARMAEMKRNCPTCMAGSGGEPIPISEAIFQVEIAYAPSLPAARLVGGDDPTIQPWELRHICGGALIARNWVLTAAHCVDQAKVDAGLVVRLGAENIAGNDGLVVRVDRMVRHALFRPDDFYDHDIALLHLAPDPRSRAPWQIAPIAVLRTPLPLDNDGVFASGWGRIADTRAEPVAILRKYDMRVLPRAECLAMKGYGPHKIHDRVLCVGADHVKTCEGDSGGALALYPRKLGAPLVLAGIVSWNKTGCDGTRDWRPGVYTRVSSYADWIKGAMRTTDNSYALPTDTPPHGAARR